MNQLIISIWESGSEDGFMYEIYQDEQHQEDGDSLDGGLCTSTIENALQMATDQAKELLTRANKK